MGEEPIQLSGVPPLTVAVRRSARAKRLSLRVSRLDGRVTLTLPKSVRRSEGVAFVTSKTAWLRAKLAERPQPLIADFGHKIPVEGRLLTIFEGERTRLRPEIDAIEISPKVRSAPGAVQGLLKARARDRLIGASDRFSQALGRPYSKITLRDTRSRWGSCTAAGGLMFSWRLILAPPQVLDYVAAHEVAHLAHMNHAPEFWAEVKRLYPGFEAPRMWLRQNGEDLHRYRFSHGAVEDGPVDDRETRGA